MTTYDGTKMGVFCVLNDYMLWHTNASVEFTLSEQMWCVQLQILITKS